jgi:methionyl-tRNA synthetase
MSIPLGHTQYTWSTPQGATPLGHTTYSWGTSSSKATTAPSSTSSSEVKESLERRVGPLSHFAGEASAALNKFYVTTAINYTNGDPHVGHAYEGVTTDIVARYHRIFGRDTFFCTGTDEHGEKIAKTAAKEGVEPIDICNRYAGRFQELNQKLHISNDCYIRTTQDRHKKVVKELWNRCVAKGDIWLGQYEGWYNVKEECYVKETDAEQADFKDAAGEPLIKMSQESYLLNMGKYQQQLKTKIENDEFKIRPKTRRDEILKFLNDEKLRDLSLSRNNFKWGIPIPGSDDHVMYVWFDALTNYGSAVNFLDTNPETNPLSKFWPADVHVIGKDITRFHCIYWPIMLMSAEVELPKGVYAHGFVMDKNGQKMSKSVGNVVDPNDMLQLYSSDTIRYYMIRETIYGDDAPFNEEHLKELHNANLADGLGNLFRRGLSLCGKYTDVNAPTIPTEDSDVCFDTAAFIYNIDEAMRELELKKMIMILVEAVNKANKYLTDQEPWKMKKQPERQRAVVRTVLESCYYFAHVLHPVCPVAAEEMFKQLMTPKKTLRELSSSFNNLTSGASIAIAKNSPILFTKFDLKASGESKESLADAKAKKKQKQQENAKSSQKGSGSKGGGKGKGGSGGGPTDPNQDAFTRILLKVGIIQDIKVHEAADKLYIETINLGEEKGPRQIVSGLKAHYPDMLSLKGKKVIVRF